MDSYPLKVWKSHTVRYGSMNSNSCILFQLIKIFSLLLLDSQSSVLLKLYLQYKGPKMILGFNDRSKRCKMWRGYEGIFSCEWWWVYLPHCVTINMYSEYKVVITMLIPMRIMVIFDHEKDVTTTKSSPIRLIVRG